MMLSDGVDDKVTQFVFPGNLHTVFDMGDQNQAGHGRCQMVVFIYTTFLVFDEIQRFLNFTDIVIIPADFGQQVVRTNFRCCSFHKGSDDDRVMIGPRRFDHEPSQDRPIQAG